MKVIDKHWLLKCYERRLNSIKMKKKITYILLLTFVIQFNGFAQPQPFIGNLLFNLTENEFTGNFITADELENKNIRFLSNNPDSKLKYDTRNKAFSFTTEGWEYKMFAILYKNDTIFIDYPSLPFVSAVFIKNAIPLNGKNFSFYNRYTYDAIHSNNYYYHIGIFNLCQGCFISEEYEMQEKTKNQIKKKHFIHTIKLTAEKIIISDNVLEAELTEIKNDTLIKSSNPFNLNNILCKWKQIEYPNGETTIELNDNETHKILLSYSDNFKFGNDFSSADYFDKHFQDVNFDGYKDFLITSYGSSAMTDMVNVHLFNRKTKLFEFSEDLSDNQIEEIDNINRILITFSENREFIIRKIHFFDKNGRLFETKTETKY